MAKMPEPDFSGFKNEKISSRKPEKSGSEEKLGPKNLGAG